MLLRSYVSYIEAVKNYCRNPGSNQGPLDLQSNALPTELFRLQQKTLFKNYEYLYIFFLFYPFVDRVKQ